MKRDDWIRIVCWGVGWLIATYAFDMTYWQQLAVGLLTYPLVLQSTSQVLAPLDVGPHVYACPDCNREVPLGRPCPCWKDDA